MTLFLKKRGDLPKQPDLSKQEGFGLFVQRDPDSGKETEILAAHEPSSAESTRRPSHDVTDVDAVDVVDVTEPQRAEPESAEPRAPLAVPGLRATRRPKPTVLSDDEPSEPAVAPAPAPQPAPTAPAAPVADAPTIRGLRVTRKVKAEPHFEAAEPVNALDQGDQHAQTSDESQAPAPDVSAKPKLSDLAKRFQKSPAAEPQVEAKSSGSLLGRFNRKKADTSAEAHAAEPVSAAPVAAEKKPLSGLWSRTKTAGATKADRAKPSAGKERRTVSGDQLDLLVEFDAERRVYWRVTADGLAQVDEAQVQQAASFSATDARYPTDAVLSYNQAKDLALSEIGEDCRIVNASKSARVVYATKATRIDGLACAVGPGVALVDQLLAADARPEKDLIVGFLLADGNSTQSLAILYHVNAQGTFSEPQVTVNPDNLSFTLSQFASGKRLNVDEAEVLLFKNAELLAVAGNLACYPNEAVWNGVPVRKLLWVAALVSSVAAIGSVGYAGQAFLHKHSLESEKASLSANVKQVDDKLKQTISSSLVSFAATQAVDVKLVTDRAAQLWVPYSKVTLEATATAQRFDVLMPLTRGGLFNNRPSVLGQLAASDVQPLIGMSAPDGCLKDIPGVSGGIDAIQITISCESVTRAVHRYRVD